MPNQDEGGQVSVDRLQQELHQAKAEWFEEKKRAREAEARLREAQDSEYALRQDVDALINEKVELYDELDNVRNECDRLRAECRYEIESGHFVRCPENHGSNGSLYDELDETRAELAQMHEELAMSEARLREAKQDTRIWKMYAEQVETERNRDTEDERDKHRVTLRALEQEYKRRRAAEAECDRLTRVIELWLRDGFEPREARAALMTPRRET